MADKKTHHVVMNPSGGWSVKKGGAERVAMGWGRSVDPT
jgi:hypothetical protein